MPRTASVHRETYRPACAVLASSGGPLAVHPIPNGPLHVKGNRNWWAQAAG